MTVGGDAPRWVRLAWLRHYMIHWMIGTAVFVVVGRFTLPPETMDILGWAPSLMIVPFALALIGHHRIPACEVCVRKMPLNGPELAERRRFLLYWQHRVLWLLAPYLVITTVTLLIGGSSDSATVKTWAGAFGGLAWVPSLFVIETHDRLSAWCPWCRDDGDDDEEETPAPTPVPAGTKEA